MSREKKSHFLNMDIPVNIAHMHLKFRIYILEIQMEGTVSQNVDLGLSFYFIKSRILCTKNI